MMKKNVIMCKTNKFIAFILYSNFLNNLMLHDILYNVHGVI